jgi:hypothetical protein
MTTIPFRPLPPAWDSLQQALRQRRAVRVQYHDRQRVICPHAIGWKNHRPLLLAYQADGHTSQAALTDPRKRWRCLYIDEIDDITLADDATPWQTATNYNASQPFPSSVDVVIAIPQADPPLRS